jgi:hypothetical protein
VAPQTQSLKIQQVGCLRITGEATYGFNMIGFRGLPRDACAASTTAIAVPKQGPRFEIHAPRALSIFVSSNFDFPVNIIQIAPSARIVRFRGGLLPRRLNVLSAFQHAAVADAETRLAGQYGSVAQESWRWQRRRRRRIVIPPLPFGWRQLPGNDARGPAQAGHGAAFDEPRRHARIMPIRR